MKIFYLLLVFMWGCLHNQAQTILAHYPFNGNANDQIGSTHGSISGALLSTDRFNITASSYSYDGINDYINLGNSAVIKPVNSLTVSLWFQMNSTGALIGRSMISNTQNAGYDIKYYTSSNSIVCDVRRNGVYGSVLTSAVPYEGNGWHFITMTYDGRYLKLYLDGVLKGTNDAGGTYPITYLSTNNTYIGVESTSTGIDGNYYWKGKLDHIKIYSGAMSATDIYNEYINDKPIPNIGLKLWLRSDSAVNLNGPNVNQWNDISGNNQHASQLSTSSQPQLISNSLNGKPIIRFDGVNDILKSPSLNLSNTKSTTVFVVNKSLNDAITLEHSRDINTNPNGFYILDNYNSTGLASALKGNAIGIGNYQSTFKSNVTNYTPKVCFTSFDKSQSSYLSQIKMRVNGINLDNVNGYGGSHTDNFSNDTIFIGGRGSGGSFMNGDIAEIILYDRLLTAAERNHIEYYLAHEFNLSLSIAENKPGSGNTLDFDGTNDYVECNNYLVPVTGDFTTDFWVYNQVNSGYREFISQGASGSAFYIGINNVGNGSIRCGDQWQTTGIILPLNKWTHITMVKAGNTASLFLDGILKASHTGYSISSAGTTTRIGRQYGAAAEYANAMIDEVRIWNIALTQEQIRNRMCHKINLGDSLYSNLTAYFNFDENSGNIAYDGSGKEKHATLMNGAVRITSSAPIGNMSANNYSGSLSSANAMIPSGDDFTATMSGGSADGIHVYAVHENPNSISGIDSLSNNEAYFGVHLVNGNSAFYNARYHYNTTGGFNVENFLNLYKRNNNGATVWSNAGATLNTDSNTLVISGQNTEYIIGGLPYLVTFYHDADGDGFGNPNDSLQAYSIPPNYVASNTDCNDTDSLEHPGQIWFIDNDHDDFGTGSFVTQCNRPLHGFSSSELIASTGDCDDNNINIYPAYQHFEYSNAGNFSTQVITPADGDSYTTFNFEVIYKNATGTYPTTTFPRVILDYEGNGIYNNSNDRTIFMTEDDLSDTNTVDGKKYIAFISGLPTGTNWKTFIQTNPEPCGQNFGPFNYPDVLVRPDLEIFANDISFSIPHPPVSSPLTINAVIHNVSDYPAQNFIVHLHDQFDSLANFPDITVNSLAPHTSTSVSWNVTTINVPSWHPIQIIADYSNVINESNELDNTAIRPYINGNYNLPGGIITTAFVSPSISYQSSGYLGISGHAHYTGTAVPLIDSSVAGATVTFTITETGASFTTYTNSQGNYFFSFPKPLPIGIYHITGTCTDFTLTGNLSTQFEIIAPVITTCTLPDLIAQINISSNLIVQGDSVYGSIVVKNVGQVSSIPAQLSVNQSGGNPLLSSLYNIPTLSPNATYSILFNIQFNIAGQYSLCVNADATYVLNECYENNSTCKIISVLPPLPDIVPTLGPNGTHYQCEINSVGFQLHNYGGISTGPFNCRVITKLGSSIINITNQLVSNILPLQNSPSNFAVINIPFFPPAVGNYTFEVYADYPSNEVIELSEINNNASYMISVFACKPDLNFSSCEFFNVTSSDGNYIQGSDIMLKAQVNNIGKLAYSGSLPVRFALSNGPVYDTILSVNLTPGSNIQIDKVVPAPLTPGKMLTVTADPDDIINEFSEANNSISGNMCWDFQPVPFCSFNFWDKTYLVNQAVYLSVGVQSNYLYDADTLKVKFQVSGPGISGTILLGYGTLYQVKQTCNCPLGATLPINFAFPQIGTYVFTMTVDPDNDYAECNENNNILIRQVQVNNLPDMRILSQYIAPSKLNPDPNEAITMNISYENIGASNINDIMKLRVLVDNSPLDSIYPVNGLVYQGNNTLTIPASWSSNQVGVHIIRAIIDDDYQITETNELNNEATRAIIVGEAANLYFQVFTSNSLTPSLNTLININIRVGNSGDLGCGADLQLFYVNDFLDTIFISTHVINVGAHDSINLSIPWMVLDARTSLIAKIVNSNTLEYTYDDNQSELKIGEMKLVMNAAPACLNSNTNGIANAYVIGGEAPYNYFWNNGPNADQIIAPAGNYSVTVSDNTGQTVSGQVNIDNCPAITLSLKLFIQSYYNGNSLMKNVLVNQGKFNLPIDVDTITIELHQDTLSFPLLATTRSILKTDGTLTCYFNNPTLIGKHCYLVIKHRNCVETWSSNSILISAQCNYDFSTASNKAYGNNQEDLSGNSTLWALFNGDLNADENIDLLDATILEADISNFEFGYFSTDLNGDGNVDLLDIPTLENNINNFIFSSHP